MLCRQPGNWNQYNYYYEENTISDADNFQTAAGDQATTLSAEDNEHSHSVAAVSNHNQSNAPFSSSHSSSPFRCNPIAYSPGPIGLFSNMEGASSQHESVTAYHLCSDTNLSILFYNDRNLLPKFDELCAFCENNRV